MAYRKYRFHQNNKTIASTFSHSSLPSSLSPSYLPSSFSRNWIHQVYLNFRGEDVRRGFLSHLLKELERKGITPFIDTDINMNKSIAPELRQAIRSSRISIVLISKNYASSAWCLDELVEIMHCRDELGQILMTIFYEVDPSDVRKQMGYFGDVFNTICAGRTEEMTQIWRDALHRAANVAGYHSRNWKNEADMIENVANDVSNMLNNATPSSDSDGLVGIEAHITQISSLLSLQSDEVRMVGIWGPAGIGKTTIARALYSKLSNYFTLSAFMESTRGGREKIYSDDYAFMLHLQEQLLSKILNQNDLKINHLGVAEGRLKDKKVLIVLDDVDDLKQLKAMACKTQWFGCGSRIIITTEDKKLLKAHGINHIYHVDFPLSSQALEILCLSAFDQNSPYDGFEELTMEVTGLAGDLPLGLCVFGSYLRGMSKDEWIHALPRLRTSLDWNIEKVLRFSYESLCDKDKDLFLHVACLFEGGSASYLAESYSNLDVRHGLQVLAEKSLISIENGARLVMHNLLLKLGKEIIKKENRGEHGRRKFMVDSREISDALADNTGAGSVQSIDLNLNAIKDELSRNERLCEGLSDPFMALSPLPCSGAHQVYLSFRGEDVRRGFLSHLHKEFERKGITPFIDNDIDRRKSIGPELIEAIKGPRISIVLISKNYASSTWCLNELVQIMKCRDQLDHTVITIFYEVDSSDVRKQMGYFGEVFNTACAGRTEEMTQRWRHALHEAANILGFNSLTWNNEADMIEKVATDVSNILNTETPSRDFDGLVGIEAHFTQISSLLSLESDEVRMVGIWGPAGIGKTIIARALYSQLSNHFTHSAFVESGRGSREERYSDDIAFMLHLQEHLLSKTLNQKDLKIDHLGVVEERLKDKKVLVVLDDVDDLKQLKAMAYETRWFGRGSRIIITTKDKRILKAHGINHIYHVDFPLSSQALEIFCLSAFDQKSPYDGFEELTMEVTGLAGGLPLGLCVFGSYLRGMSKDEWIHALPRLRTSLDWNIEKVLRFSYEELCDDDKDLFLHIACFFKGKSTSNLEEYLAESDLDVRHGLQVLVEKSLISIDKGERLVMHNLLEQMGKKIAHKEKRDKHGRWKFLVDAQEINGPAIKDKLGTDERACEEISVPFNARSPLPCSCTHQVFPSFRGEDVRKGFLSHLLKEFERKGITSFIDNDIERSKSIGPELIEAIKGPRISIVLISKNYASSTWCLDELVQILKCRKESGQTVMTIFYEVVPSNVKKQRGYFGKAFKKTCVGKAVEDVKRWKQALEEVAEIAGYDSSIWKNEADMIERVATDVSNKLNSATSSSDSDGLVGIGDHITQISSLLSLESNKARMVGIWGPAGIGKTTIARALYRKLSNNFALSAFMESIRGSREKIYSDDHVFMLHLQEQLLSKTLNQKDLKIDHLDVAEERLKDKKVLVVLDDVDDLRQLKAMACKTQWFGSGSRIIITTKDKQLLQAHGIKHIYHVDFPRSSQALEIFCLSAFGQKFPHVGFEELTKEVTRLSGNLPLGLSVFGSYLRGMSKDKWIHALPRLQTSLDGNIEKVLRYSYEALCDKDKDLFLHIACLFEGESTSYLEECLAESDLDVSHGLEVLVEKSLTSINEELCLSMHNLVEQLGKEIVRKEYKDEPGKRKFLVDAREICDVLADNTGSGTVIGINLNLTAIKDELSIDERAFEGMSSLQFLKFHNPYIDANNDNSKLILPWGLNNLPRKLRVLHWHKFPMSFLPPKFRAEFLTHLEMRNSNLEKLWEGARSLRYLKRMDLSYSYNLKEFPNLSNATNLETLILNACESLVEIPPWIQNLSSLTHLKMVGCKKLKVLPTNINLKSLQHLDLSHCTQLKTFPEISTRIEYLDLENTGVDEVPSSVRSWPNLVKLSMRGYKSLKIPNIPDST